MKTRTRELWYVVDKWSTNSEIAVSFLLDLYGDTPGVGVLYSMIVFI